MARAGDNATEAEAAASRTCRCHRLRCLARIDGQNPEDRRRPDRSLPQRHGEFGIPSSTSQSAIDKTTVIRFRDDRLSRVRWRRVHCPSELPGQRFSRAMLSSKEIVLTTCSSRDRPSQASASRATRLRFWGEAGSSTRSETRDNEELRHLEISGTLARMHLRPMKERAVAAGACPPIAIAGPGGIALCDSMGRHGIHAAQPPTS